MTDRPLRRPPAEQGTASLVAMVLAQPDLPERIRELPPADLARVVARVGLEDASELVAFATPAQLLAVLDEDLWQVGAAGEDDRFDEARFVTWLEVLLEAGDAVCAEKLSEMPEDLLVLALKRRLLVVSLEALAREIGEAEDGELADKALSDHLHEELDDFVLVARRAEGWDALLGAVLALDREHHDLLQRVLGRCARLADDELDDAGGLYAVLNDAASLEDDVAAEREERRGREGHVTGSAAKSFLALARRPLADGPYVRDVVTRGWFRDLAPREVATADTASRTTELLRALASPEPDAPRPERGKGRRPRALPATAATTRLPTLAGAMGELAASSPEAFAARSEEIAYLANVLAAGAAREGRRLRQGEAVTVALAVTSLGLELVATTRASRTKTLGERTADELFRRGMHALHTRVVSPAREARARLRGGLDPERAALLAALGDDVPWLVGTLAGGPERPLDGLDDVTRIEGWLAELG